MVTLGGVLALAVGVATPTRAQEPRQNLPWRAGGRVGFTVDAATFPDSSGWTLELYVRIPPTTLSEMSRAADGSGRLALEVRLRGPFGGRWVERQEEFAFVAGDTVGGFGKVVVMRFPTRPGEHQLQVQLEDLLSVKPGLVYLGRKAHESVTVKGAFVVPRPQADRDLSDIEFVWGEADTVSGAFRRAGHALLPNPERLYGLFSADLRASFAARSRAGDARPWHWTARVLDAKEHVLASQESTASADRRLDGACRLDLSTLPSGGYDLEVRAWQDGDAGPLVRRARFSVAWQRSFWQRNPRDIEDDVHFLLNPDDEEAFAQMQPGEQERYLEDYWRRRDPSPGTAVNEARDTYLQRVEYANRMYTRPGLLKGMFSDMGRVYIRYGEPTEISHQVIPAGAETVLQVLEELEARDERPTGDVHEKGLGGDQRSFEVWTYEAPIPPPVDADPEVMDMRRQKRLIFLFVDEQGLGNYTLRYTTE